MDDRLGMNREGGCARIDESWNVLVRIGDHQMHIEWKTSDFSNRLDHGRSDRNVWHEMAVHDVHVKGVGAGVFDFPDVIPEGSEIRRQNRRSDSNRHWLTSTRMLSDLVNR